MGRVMGIEKEGENEREGWKKMGERGKEGELYSTRNRTLAVPLHGAPPDGDWGSGTATRGIPTRRPEPDEHQTKIIQRQSLMD